VPHKKKKKKKKKEKRKEREKKRKKLGHVRGGEGFTLGCIYMCTICLFYELKVIIRSSGNMTAHRERNRFRGGGCAIRAKKSESWMGRISEKGTIRTMTFLTKSYLLNRVRIRKEANLPVRSIHGRMRTCQIILKKFDVRSVICRILSFVCTPRL
jgi:hypothetical protein